MMLPPQISKVLELPRIIINKVRKFIEYRKAVCLEKVLYKLYKSTKIKMHRYGYRCLEVKQGDFYLSKYFEGGICVPPDSGIIEHIASALRYVRGNPRATAIYVRVPTELARCSEEIAKRIPKGFKNLAEYIEMAKKLGMAIEIDGEVVGDVTALAYPPIHRLVIMSRKEPSFVEVLYVTLG